MLAIFERMQNIDIFRLIVGFLMSLATIYFLTGLFPGMEKRQLKFERRIKRGGGDNLKPMPRLMRVVAVLMFASYAGQILADAFHCNLGTVIGVSQAHLTFFSLFLFPPLLVLLGIRHDRYCRKKPNPDT